MTYAYRKDAPALLPAGLNPLPIVPGTKRPALSGWQQWCSERIPAELVKDYACSPISYGIGLALGYRGLVAIDVDTDDAALQAVIREVLPKIHPTMKGRRGFAVLGYDPSGTIRTRHIFGLVDVLGPGSQKVIPPTAHPSGPPFKWLASPLNGNSPESLPIIAPDIADRLAEALGPYGARPQSMLTKRPTMISVPANLSEQERDRQRRYAEVILARELMTLGTMSSNSGRNRETFRLVCRLGRWVHAGIIPAERLTADVLGACSANGLVDENGVRSVLATIESGLRKSVGDLLPDLGGRSHG